jgi:hypothetical protein
MACLFRPVVGAFLAEADAAREIVGAAAGRCGLPKLAQFARRQGYKMGQVPTFIELLEEIATAKPVISIPPAEVDRLVGRFGDRVRQMGRWNVSTDGSLDIPIAVIREASAELGSRALFEAVTEIKTESFSRLLESSAAVLLIDKIRETYDRYFRQVMQRYQNATDPVEAAQIRDELVREVFGE